MAAVATFTVKRLFRRDVWELHADYIIHRRLSAWSTSETVVQLSCLWPYSECITSLNDLVGLCAAVLVIATALIYLASTSLVSGSLAIWMAVRGRRLFIMSLAGTVLALARSQRFVVINGEKPIYIDHLRRHRASAIDFASSVVDRIIAIRSEREAWTRR